MKKILALFLILVWGIPAKGQNIPINYNSTNGAVNNPPPGVTAYNFPVGKVAVGGVPLANTATITSSASVAAALPNAAATTGTQLLTGNADTSGNVTISTGSLTSSLILNPQANVQMPNVMLNYGPGAGTILFIGDSLTQGIGIAGAAPRTPGAGQLQSYPDVFAASAIGLGMSPFNVGLSGWKLSDAMSAFNNGGVTTTGSATYNTNTITLTSTTGVSTGMSVTDSQHLLALGSYISGLSGTTATLTQTIAYGSGRIADTFYIANGNDYGNPAGSDTNPIGSGMFNASPWALLSAASGNKWVVLNIGTDDFTTNGLAYTGTATTGSGTITGMTVIANSPASNLSSSSGYNAWGIIPGTGTISLGTVSSATSNSMIVSTPSAVTSSMTSFRMAPQITAWTGSYTSFTSTLTTYANVMVTTIMPFANYDTQTDAQWLMDINRQTMNQWIKSTYANNAVSGVTFADVANIPQLQFGSTYDYFRNGNSYPHCGQQGYQVLGTFIASQFFQNYRSNCLGFINPLAEGSTTGDFSASGVPATSLPGTLVYVDGTTGQHGPVHDHSTVTYTFNSGLDHFINFDGLNNVTNLNQITFSTGTLSGNFLNLTTGSGNPITINATNSGGNTITFNASGSGSGKYMRIAWLDGGTYYFENGIDNASNGTKDWYVKNDQQSGHIDIDITPSADDVNLPSGNLNLTAVGKTLSLKGGSNAASGTVTLSGGSATLSTTAAVAGDWVGCSLKVSSGTPGTFAPDGYVLNSGTITFNGVATDNSTYTWWLNHPNQ